MASYLCRYQRSSNAMIIVVDDPYLKVFVSFGNNKKDYLQWPFRGRLDMAILNLYVHKC